MSICDDLVLTKTKIKRLPDQLWVGGKLVLARSQVNKLPDDLYVGGYLNIRNTDIDYIPENIRVKFGILLEERNISKYKNIAYAEDCGNLKRTIFAFKNNNEIQITAGCFNGTLIEFEQAVDKKYSGQAAEQYKQAARDCVRRLKDKATY